MHGTSPCTEWGRLLSYQTCSGEPINIPDNIWNAALQANLPDCHGSMSYYSREADGALQQCFMVPDSSGGLGNESANIDGLLASG